jgi:hypothetical protein
MHNINNCVSYTFIRSVLIISINEVWIVCEIDQLSKTHLIPSIWNYHKHICNWYDSKHIFKSHRYEIYISIFIKGLKSLLSADNIYNKDFKLLLYKCLLLYQQELNKNNLFIIIMIQKKTLFIAPNNGLIHYTRINLSHNLRQSQGL